LPPGDFKGWCGREDRYFLVVEGWLQAYDGTVKVSSPTLSISPSMPFQCSKDGRQAVYVDNSMRQVKTVDIASGPSRVLATYLDSAEAPTISFSPDLQSVATDRQLGFAVDSTLKIILVNASGKAGLRSIKWSNDSSKLFVAYFKAVEVFDAKGRRIISGPLPKGSFFRDGWFDVGKQALVLSLGSDKDEFGAGFIIRCDIAGWKCTRLRSRVAKVSIGGRGIIGTISPEGKAPTPGEEDDGGTILYYPGYSAEVRDRASKLLARQIFLTNTDGRNFEVTVAPSGAKAIVSWTIEPTAECRPQQYLASFCTQGILVDLSKVVR
jgi:hypothetical protein